MHPADRPGGAQTVARLANAAAPSRSAFFDRFTRAVGVAPLEYGSSPRSCCTTRGRLSAAVAPDYRQTSR